MKYDGIPYEDLPLFDRKIHGYSSFDIGKVPDWIPEHKRVYVRMNYTLEVRVATFKEVYDLRDYYRKGEYNARNGHVYRWNPVPGVHNYGAYVGPTRKGGFKKEHHHNVVCDDELKEYGNLVRRKRAHVCRSGFDWDFYYGWKRERGWKRSKKKRQWM